LASRIPGLRCAPTWALESRPFGAEQEDAGSASVPHVAFVEFDLMAAQEGTQFVLECLDAVMRVLIFDVAFHTAGALGAD
jgi:hypothetical protein